MLILLLGSGPQLSCHKEAHSGTYERAGGIESIREPLDAMSDDGVSGLKDRDRLVDLAEAFVRRMHILRRLPIKYLEMSALRAGGLGEALGALHVALGGFGWELTAWRLDPVFVPNAVNCHPW